MIRISRTQLLAAVAVFMLLGVAATAQVTTTQLSGTVVHKEGNQLVVKMANGDIRMFNVPSSRMATIDGKEMRLVDVPVGTKLNATVTTTSTSSTQRTVQSLTGKVWFAQGTTVILTLPDGKNRQYNVTNRDIKFKVDGRDATVFELRKGMTVSAEKIVEEPVVEVATNVAVTGSAPPAPVAKAEPTPAAPTPRPAPTPAPAAKQTPPPPPPPPPAEPAPAKLPKTGSPLPLIGLLGGLMTAAGLGLRQWRRR